MAIIGYARVSTDEQATEAQEIELRAAGCDAIVEEHGSGASRARPALHPTRLPPRGPYWHDRCVSATVQPSQVPVGKI